MTCLMFLFDILKRLLGLYSPRLGTMDDALSEQPIQNCGLLGFGFCGYFLSICTKQTGNFDALKTYAAEDGLNILVEWDEGFELFFGHGVD